MFTNRYITKGMRSEIPAALQILPSDFGGTISHT